MEKFYIIRTDYHGERWLYGMTYTLAEALKFVHDEHLQNADTAIEFCRGSFPFDFEVYKTLFAKPKTGLARLDQSSEGRSEEHPEQDPEQQGTS